MPQPAAAPAPSKQGTGRSRTKAKAAGFVDPYAAREAERYAEPIASREAILELLADAEGPQTAEDLAQRLRLT